VIIIACQVILPHQLAYPSEPPLIFIQSKALALRLPRKQQGNETLLALQILLWQIGAAYSEESGGEVGIVFQLSAFVEDIMMQGMDNAALASTVSHISFLAIASALKEIAKEILMADVYEDWIRGDQAGAILSSSLETEVRETDTSLMAPHEPPSVVPVVVSMQDPDEESSETSASQSDPSIITKRQTGGRNRSAYHPFWTRATPTAGTATNTSTPTNSPLLAVRQTLPAWSLREEFLQLCADNKVPVYYEIYYF
jgi:hypothetical protein